MFALFFAIDSLLVCAFTSMAQCRVRENGFVYISEFILLCKQGAHTWVLPWVCVLAFAALVFVQMRWMFQVALAWRAASAAETSSGQTSAENHAAINGVDARPDAAWSMWPFWALAVMAVLGLVIIVLFDWRGGSVATNSTHHVGVALLATGTYFILQMIWVALRAGDCNQRLRSGTRAVVPWYSWVECDVLFLIFLGVFLITAQFDTNREVGAVFEFAAFVLLLAQTTWLLVLCAERDGRRVTEELQTLTADTSPEPVPKTGSVLLALLCAYSVEALLVLLIVL